VIVCRDLESAKIVMENRFITHIITDAQLSDTMAFEGLHLLESVRRNLSAIPVVVTTAHLSDDVRRAAERGGASAVLQKPIAIRDLQSLIPPASGEVGRVTLVPTL
jgi:CheY-like chemotaxis protein